MTVKGNIGKGMMALLAAAALTTGCNRSIVEEPTDNGWQVLTGDKPLRFSLAVQKEKGTKAPVTGTSLPAGTSFGVFGWYHDGEGTTDGSWARDEASGTNSPDFMYDQQVVNDGTADEPEYNYSPLRYWPHDTGLSSQSPHTDKLSFWGYFPHGGTSRGIVFRDSGGNTFTNTTSGRPASVHFTTTDGHTDFMTSNFVQDLVKPADDAPVHLSFSHHLSMIQFKAKTQKDYTLDGYELAIWRIELIYAYRQADYDIGSDTWSNHSDDPRDPSIVLIDRELDPLTKTATLCGTEADAGLVIPQPLYHSPEKTVMVKVSFVQKAEGILMNQEVTLPLLFTGGADEWEPYKKYIYTFTLSLDSMFIDVTAESWKDVEINPISL